MSRRRIEHRDVYGHDGLDAAAESLSRQTKLKLVHQSCRRRLLLSMQPVDESMLDVCTYVHIHMYIHGKSRFNGIGISCVVFGKNSYTHGTAATR